MSYSPPEGINQSLQEVIDRHTDAWGVKVTSVELKHVDLPSEMQRAMAKQAEAERERRAKVIAAEGEVQASQQLQEAAATIGKPGAMTLRYLQTLSEIAIENNSTIAFPIPINLLEALGGSGNPVGDVLADTAKSLAASNPAPARRFRCVHYFRLY